MISVIIPSYRPQHHTVECLESIRRQTLDARQFEVIVVLNGEREPYEAMLLKALPSNGRLLYSPKASACSSRNMGLDEARGEYICFIDDDDKISPTYLQSLLKVADRDTIAASNCLSIFEDGHTEHNAYTGEYESKSPKGAQPFYIPKKIFSVQNIYESIWNEPYFYSSNNLVMVHIRNIRKKLGDDPQNCHTIRTVWGRGYRIE